MQVKIAVVDNKLSVIYEYLSHKIKNDIEMALFCMLILFVYKYIGGTVSSPTEHSAMHWLRRVQGTQQT